MITDNLADILRHQGDPTRAARQAVARQLAWEGFPLAAAQSLVLNTPDPLRRTR